MSDRLFPELVPTSDASERPSAPGAPRLRRAERKQIRMVTTDLDSTLAADHRARVVWAFVQGLDLATLHATVRATEGNGGRPPADPAILMALWLFATLDGVGSARQIDRLCECHDAYRWICGGVTMNYHGLADFRVEHEAFLDKVLTDSVAALLSAKLVTLDRVAQDGIRVRASAGTGSFHRKSTLERNLDVARAQVDALKKEIDADPAASEMRKRKAQERAERERAERIEEALKQLPEIERRRNKSKKGKDRKKPEDKTNTARASTSDPDARVMKMGDGGYRPAFNGQFVTTVGSQIIVGVDVSNAGSDQGLLVPMHDQLRRRYGRAPGAFLVDAGFSKIEAIDAVSAKGTVVYSPVQKPKDLGRDPHAPLPDDPPAIAEWRRRMGTDAAKALYKERAATAECVNALARARGLLRFVVRGIRKVRAVMLWHALAHNLMRAETLRERAAMA